MEPESLVILRSPVAPRRDPRPSESSFESVGPALLEVDMAEVRSHAELQILRNDPAILAAAPNMPMTLVEPIARAAQPSTDEDTVTWGVQAVRADESPFDGSGITVAVLDTGIDVTHPAFDGVRIDQKDFTGEGDGDDNGHGTHCAGTVFGQNVDGLRIGVAPGVDRALIGKVLGTNGTGSTGSIVEAIQWALSSGAHVISLSLGINFPGMVKRLIDVHGFPADLATSKALDAYCSNVNLFGALATMAKAQSSAFGTAAILVAPAGNESNRHLDMAVVTPAAVEGFYSVGALEKASDGYLVPDFSNTGPNVVGPGVAVQSAKTGGPGLQTMNGTSMATHHVAGVAALWGSRLLNRGGLLTTDALAAQLAASGRQDVLMPGFEPLDVGAGLIQAPLN